MLSPGDADELVPAVSTSLVVPPWWKVIMAMKRVDPSIEPFIFQVPTIASELCAQVEIGTVNNTKTVVKQIAFAGPDIFSSSRISSANVQMLQAMLPNEDSMSSKFHRSLLTELPARLALLFISA